MDTIYSGTFRVKKAPVSLAVSICQSVRKSAQLTTDKVLLNFISGTFMRSPNPVKIRQEHGELYIIDASTYCGQQQHKFAKKSFLCALTNFLWLAQTCSSNNTYKIHCCVSRRGQLNGTATCHKLDVPWIEFWKGHNFPHLSRPALGPTQPPTQWVLGYFWGVKPTGHGINHRIPSMLQGYKKE
jgi:hypothetical protein